MCIRQDGLINKLKKNKKTTDFATSGRAFTCNGIVAIDYLQWFTCDDSFHSIEITIASSHMDIHMKTD